MKNLFEERMIRRPSVFLFFSIALTVLLLAILNVRGIAKENSTKVDVVGTLNRVVVVADETTGWIVKLDMEQEISGMPTIEIDVDPKGQSLEKYTEKHVKITGKVLSRIGMGRGDYPVIEIETIQLAGSNRE